MESSTAKKQLVDELHAPARKNFPRRRTIIKGLDDLWQMDLADLQKYSKVNKNFNYILVVIDTFSKYLWVRPLKTKCARDVAEAMGDILSKAKRCPKLLQSDLGTEFYNATFQALLKKYNIKHYSTYTKMKAAIAERVIRTLKEKLFKYFSLNGAYKWLDILPDIAKNYNQRKHRTIGMKPCDVTKDNEEKVYKSTYDYAGRAGRKKFKIGDFVRISKAKHVFEKGYTPNWTTELFKVAKVKITQPITYLLEDLEGRPISGAFYEQELQKTKNPDVYLVEKIIRRKGRKVLVKWLGFDSTHNSWINAENRL